MIGNNEKSKKEEDQIMEGSETPGSPFNAIDANVMASAFRAALRKPAFSGDGNDGYSDAYLEQEEREERERDEVASGRGRDIIDQELRDEGRSVRNVSGGRKWGESTL